MWEFEPVSRPPKQPLPSRKESRKVMGFGLVFWKTLVLFKSDLQDPFPSFCSYQSSVLFMVKPLLFWVLSVFYFFLLLYARFWGTEQKTGWGVEAIAREGQTGKYSLQRTHFSLLYAFQNVWSSDTPSQTVENGLAEDNKVVGASSLYMRI